MTVHLNDAMKFGTSDTLFIFCFSVFLFSISNSEKVENDLVIAPIFEEHLIVPLLLPSNPADFCTVIYKPQLIISPGKFYFPYQVEGIPEISWDFKANKFYTLIVLEAIQRQDTRVTTTTENVHFLGVLKKVYDVPANANSTNNTTSMKMEDNYLPPKDWWYRWVVVNIEENDMDSGTVVKPFSSSPIPQPNSTHQLIYVFAVFEQSDKFELKLNDKENSPDQLLQSSFTPLSNFSQNFQGKNLLVGGNFFYVIPKPHTIVINLPVQKIRWLT